MRRPLQKRSPTWVVRKEDVDASREIVASLCALIFYLQPLVDAPAPAEMGRLGQVNTNGATV